MVHVITKDSSAPSGAGALKTILTTGFVPAEPGLHPWLQSFAPLGRIHFARPVRHAVSVAPRSNAGIGRSGNGESRRDE